MQLAFSFNVYVIQEEDEKRDESVKGGRKEMHEPEKKNRNHKKIN